MFRILFLRLALVASFFLVPPAVAVEPVISEVQLENVDGLNDEDGDYPDWIEIYNPSAVPLTLTGYQLGQRLPATWSFPALDLPPHGYLTVFASEKNRAVANRPLHTDFALSKGESLFLTKADGTVVDELRSLPSTPNGVSYGRNYPGLKTPLVSSDTIGKWAWEATATTLAVPAYAARVFADQNYPTARNGLYLARSAPGFELRTLTGRYRPQSTGRELAILFKRPGYSALLAEQVVSTLNFASDATAQLNYRDDRIFPVPAQAPAAEKTRLYHARGLWNIPAAGKWTVAVDSFTNDGVFVYQLKVAGNEFLSNAGGGGIPIDIVQPRIGIPDPGLGGGIRFHTLTIAQAGVYPIDFYWVQPDQANVGVELSAAAGELADFSAAFKLLGSATLPITHQSTAPVLRGTEISAGRPTNAAAFVWRAKFPTPPATQQRLRLSLAYADGFRAWINGRLVAERNAPIGASLATKARLSSELNRQENFELTLQTADLTPNVAEHTLTIETLRAPEQQSLCYLHATLTSLADAVGIPTATYFAQATPGGPNEAPRIGPAAEPSVDTPRGVYPGPVSIALSSPDVGASIFYTLDGTTPRPGQALLYTAPIRLTTSAVLQAYAILPGSLPSNTILHSYLITATQNQQKGQGLPTSWGGNEANYGFNAEAVSTAGNTLEQSLQALPSLSIVIPTEDMFGECGIYANTYMAGKLSAFPASIEWIYPQSGVAWREKAEIRIKGEASRSGYFLKHGFRLDFGDGKGDLRRPVMSETQRDRFNTLVLHGSFVDNVLLLGGKAQYIRDLWIRDTLRRMGQPAAHGEYYQLYINGLYWGLYHAGERSDSQWCAEYFGGKADDWDVMDSDKVIDGNKDGWAELMERARKANPQPEDFTYVSERLDLSAFCDYMMVNLYAANTDWPGHNWYAARDKRTGVWRFISWDAEYSFDRPGLNQMSDPDSSLGGDPGDLFLFLKQFPAFRDLFANRVRKHCFSGGALTSAVADATWMRRANEIQSAIVAEYARWGYQSGGFGSPARLITPSEWQTELNRLRTTWFPARTKTLVNQFRLNGLYPDVLPPLVTPSNGRLGADGLVTLSNSGSTASLYYTLDGSDPRGADGQPSIFALPYLNPFRVTPPAVVKARGWFEQEASALTEVTFAGGQDFSGLKLAEILFNPTVFDEEFVEIINRGAGPLNLAGVKLTEAVRFTFSARSRLPAGGTMVLVRNPLSFALRYPNVVIAGTYSGALADEGERLTLLDPLGQVLDRVAYRPFDPWPVGSGSLHRLDYTLTAASAWQVRAPSPSPVLVATSPTERPFAIELGALDVNSGQLPLTFPVVGGYRYFLERNERLDGVWANMGEIPIDAVPGSQTIQVPVAGARVFYRILRLP